MPTFKIKDPQTGRTVTLTGDSPPTEAELLDIFAKAGSAPPSAVTPPEAPASARTWGDTAVDVVKGAVKGVGNTAYGLGKIVHDYTPIGRISDAIQPGAFEPQNKPPELTPTNTPQRIGYGVEQVGEFFLPTGVAGKAAKLAEVGKSAGITLAQTGSPTAATVSGGLTAVLPGGGAAQKASSALKDSARQTMADSLRATKEWAKAESDRLAPEMLKRGVGGSIKALRAQASETAARVGKNLAQAYDDAAKAGETVRGDIIRGNVQLASDSLHTLAASGKRIAVPGNQAAIAQLDELDRFVEQLPADIPVNQAAAIKQQFDDIVERAGLFGPKAMASASEKAQGWSFKKASDSFRELLNTNPTIEALNKEASFWIGLRNVVEATKLRKVGQTGGLIAAGTGAAGAAVGSYSQPLPGGAAVNALAGGLAGRQLARVLQSPQFMNQVSAPLKNALAEALASNSAGRIASVTGRILASVPARVAGQ